MQMPFSPSGPEIQVEDTLSQWWNLKHLRKKQSCLDTGNLFFAAVDMNTELQSAWFTFSKETKEEIAQVLGAYSEAHHWQLKRKCFVKQKNSKLKTLFAY